MQLDVADSWVCLQPVHTALSTCRGPELWCAHSFSGEPWCSAWAAEVMACLQVLADQAAQYGTIVLGPT